MESSEYKSKSGVMVFWIFMSSLTALYILLTIYLVGRG